MDIAWDAVLAQVAESGSAYVAGAVDAARLHDLLGIELAWQQLDDQLSTGVRQQYTFASVEPAKEVAMATFCGELATGICAGDRGTYGLDAFAFNEASFHRYGHGDLGISRHRDMNFYRLLVVGVTLAGSGELHLFDDDDVHTQTWRTRPGDLYAFRAPGFAAGVDGRPRHATGPTEGRTSLTLRWNSHGYLGGWDEAH